MRRFPLLSKTALAVFALTAAAFAATPGFAQTAPDDEAEFGTGLEFEPEAVYRSFPVTGTYRAFLPPSVDLSRFLPPVGSQGQQSSCVAWATSYGMRGYYENRRRGGASAAPLFSPAFVYNQIKNRNAACNVGTSISDALNLLKRVGTVPMSEFPYDPKTCSRLPDSSTASEAQSFRIRDWKRVDTKRLDDVKGQLFAGNPVIIGMYVNKAFYKLQGDTVFDDQNRDGGGHAMLVVGYDDQRGAFKIFNSWGRRWGDQGFGWVDYDSFQVRVHSAFVAQVPMGAAPEADSPSPRPSTPRPAPAPVSVTPTKPPPAPVQRPTPVAIPVAPKPAPEPVAPPPAPVAQTLESRLNELMSDIPCSMLRAERGAGGAMTVHGVVGRQSDRDQVAALLREQAGAAAPNLDVAVMAWPQCEVKMTFEPALVRAQGLSIRVRPPSGTGTPADGEKAVLNNGAPLILDITTPSFPSFLYVVYLQIGGEAVYVHTPAMAQNRPWPPRSHVTVGDGNGGSPSLAIGAPFGDEMILAVASPYPLTNADLPVVASDREFLSLFRRSLLGYGTRDFSLLRSTPAAAAYTLLTTKPGAK